MEASQRLGFLGPASVETQIAHSRWWCELIASHQMVLDLGSGGGLPGLVIAALRPDLSGTLLDSQQTRCDFLSEALDQLGRADRWNVAHGRAEEVARDPHSRGAYHVVVSRSFGPPSVTAECATGFLAVGGLLLVSEPRDGPSRWPEDGLDLLGLQLAEVHRGPTTTVQAMIQIRPTPDRYPRPVGRPTKRPLF